MFNDQGFNYQMKTIVEDFIKDNKLEGMPAGQIKEIIFKDDCLAAALGRAVLRCTGFSLFNEFSGDKNIRCFR